MFKLNVNVQAHDSIETVCLIQKYTLDELFNMDIPALVETLKEIYGDNYISSYFISDTI